MITDAILTRLRDTMFGYVGSTTINYIAIGSSSNPVTGAETKLVNETLRVPVTVAKVGDLILDIDAYLTETMGNISIKEVGLFANGSATKDSGTLVTRILYDKTKTGLQ